MEEQAFRTYLADSINLQAKGKHFVDTYSQRISKKNAPVDDRDAEEIAADIINKLGLTQ